MVLGIREQGVVLEVFAALSGREGIEILKEEAIDVVICDLECGDQWMGRGQGAQGD